jgi:hypothetical protein
MNDAVFDAIARRAGAIQDRRASFRALGGATLLAAAAPLVAEASNSSKKAKKKAKKKCKKQIAPCNDFAPDVCALFFDPGSEFDTCVAAAQTCCPPLAKCQVPSFFDCALDVLATLLQPI